mgnify:CR=1 FL=1|jgi:hypothetical protein
MTTSVSTSQPTQPNSNNKHSSQKTCDYERVKDCMVSTYLEKSNNEASKLNEELNCARRALSFYNRENKTKILMLALVIIMVGVMCLVTVFFSKRR